MRTQPVNQSSLRYGTDCKRDRWSYDSIKGYWVDNGEIKGNGFTFAKYSADELRDRIGAALSLYYDAPQFKKFVAKITGTDFSWASSAEKYMEMYDSL